LKASQIITHQSQIGLHLFRKGIGEQNADDHVVICGQHLENFGAKLWFAKNHRHTACGDQVTQLSNLRSGRCACLWIAHGKAHHLRPKPGGKNRRSLLALEPRTPSAAAAGARRPANRIP
jgi:hypothetical protein